MWRHRRAATLLRFNPMHAAALGMLLAALSPVVPPVPVPAVGTAKGGVAIAALPSSSPWAAVALSLRRPDGLGDSLGDGRARTALAVMAAAAATVAGRELGPDRPGSGVEVDATTEHLTVVIVVPATNADLAVKAIDAALKVLRGPPPKTTPPLPALTGGRGPLPPGDADVAAALKAVAPVDASDVAVASIGPGPGADLLRRTGLLLTTTLPKTTKPTTDTSARTPASATTMAWRLKTPAPGLHAAVEVLGALVGGTVRRTADGLVLMVDGGDHGRAMLEGVTDAPPPPDIVAEAAARRRLELALPLLDVPALVRRLADDLVDDPGHDDAGASLEVIDALGAVGPADVSRAAAALVAGGVQ